MNIANIKGSNTPLAPPQKKIDFQAARNNAAEELVSSIRRENSTEEKFAAILKDTHSIRNRVAKIKKIQNLQKLLLNDEEAEKIAKNIQQNSGSKGKLYDALHEHKQARPMLIYAALDASLKNPGLCEEARATIDSVKEELLEECSSYILAWVHSVEHVKAQIKDPELANSVLTLISESNDKKTGYLDIYQKILGIAGESGFSKVATAYCGALMDDLSHRTTSADPSYLSFSLNRISSIGAANSIFAQSQDKVEKIKEKYPFVEKTNVDFLRATLQIMQDPRKDNINNVAAGFVGVGIEKKYVFTDNSLALASELPKSTWENEKHKSEIIVAIRNALVGMSGAFLTVESDIRNVIESDFRSKGE